MKPKYKRFKYSLIILLMICLGLWLILKNFKENIVFFVTPSEVEAKHYVGGEVIRVGGLVVNDSIHKDNQILQFTITDNQANLLIHFKGTPPNLFRPGQGIVARGRFVQGVFMADEILAKHDENYMPKEVTNALKKAGTWRE